MSRLNELKVRVDALGKRVLDLEKSSAHADVISEATREYGEAMLEYQTAYALANKSYRGLTHKEKFERAKRNEWINDSFGLTN